MRNLILASILAPSLCMASINSNIMDKAKDICGSNIECTNIISIELDESYQEGINSKGKFADYSSAEKYKIRSLSDLCYKAPDKYLCNYYRIQLLEEFNKGFNK